MNYFICGFTGAGKTTLLNKWKEDPCLSKYQFIDLDTYIHKKFPMYPFLGELILDKGFPYFREQELLALKELSKNDQQIVALGGGSLTKETLEALKSWQGFWLNTEFEVCYKRILGDKNRPLADQSKEDLLELFNKRVKQYSLFDEVKNSECFL